MKKTLCTHGVLFFVFFNFLLFSINGEMIFHEYYLVGFEKNNRPATDFEAYRLLKERPLEADVNYLVLPWERIFNRKEFKQIPNITLQGGFTICENDQFEHMLPRLKKMGVEVVFTPHAVKGRAYLIKVVPFPYMSVNGVDPAPVKDIFYSYIGASTHPIRKQIISMQHPSDCYVKARKSWHWASNKPQAVIEKEAIEYKDILARSRYSLCPPGTGPGSIRFWESLQAGAIPVLFERHLRLPDGFDWKNTVICIDDLNKLYSTLAAIPPEKEKAMRELCLQAHRQFGKENLVSVVRDYYKKRSE